MPAKRVSIGHGVYREEGTNRYYVRPWIHGIRTWRKLDAIVQRYAIEEASAKKTDFARFRYGSAANPYSKAEGMFARLANLYVAASCPNRRLESRPGKFSDEESRRVKTLIKFFGNKPVSYIKLPTLPEYAEWRKRHILRTRWSGERTIDMELCTLSNVLNYGVAVREIESNPVATLRPRYRTANKVSHSKDRAVSNAEELHRIADRFFSSPDSEVLGWLALFSALTGCRNVELRQLRMDGRDPSTPGWINGAYLFLRRAKSGIHPFVEIKGPLATAIGRFRYWHTLRFPEGTDRYSPWWFPGRWDGRKPVEKGSLRQAMFRVCKELNIQHCSPHGFRAFYVTLRRSEGAGDAQIASEIGDKTVAVISQSYGDVPPNWMGQQKLSFVPAVVLPAWDRWQPEEGKVVSL